MLSGYRSLKSVIEGMVKGSKCSVRMEMLRHVAHDAGNSLSGCSDTNAPRTVRYSRRSKRDAGAPAMH